jgi:molybdate transport system regulatory protein
MMAQECSPMQISARNQFPGQVIALVSGPVNAEVTLALAGGDTLVAVVTQGSVAALGLVVGSPATAIVKAPWVTLAVGGSPASLSVRNQLAGVVHSVTPGAVNAEVALRLAGGTVVHAVVTQAAVQDMGLAPGVPARALVPAAQVVLAVA